MYRMFTTQGSHVWFDKLDALVDSYNNSYHRSIKCAPNEVTHANEAVIRRRLYPALARPSKAVFKVGQTVRVTRKKNVFQKAYLQSWSHEVFYISSVLKTNPITYNIRDYSGEAIKGCFYKSELQIVDKSSNIFTVESIVRRRKHLGRTQYLVKWQGYPNTFNSWVNQGDLFDI